MAEPVQKRAKRIQRVVAKRTPGRNSTLSRKDAAVRMASMIEEHMTELGLSEEEKNQRVARFGERVDEAIERHAKS